MVEAKCSNEKDQFEFKGEDLKCLKNHVVLVLRYPEENLNLSAPIMIG